MVIDIYKWKTLQIFVISNDQYIYDLLYHRLRTHLYIFQLPQ